MKLKLFYFTSQDQKMVSQQAHISVISENVSEQD